MSMGWSWYVIAIVVLNIIACTWLLWWTSRRHPGEAPAEQTGHVWDGNLTEFNKPLPKWWINLFYLTILFAIGYLVWFPGMGNFAGTSGWSSAAQHDAEKARRDAQLAATFAPYEGKALTELVNDERALQLGRNLFVNHCVACHGSAGQGAVGYPNLTDASWQWGGDPDSVLATILHGRNAAMPSWSATLTAMGGPTAVDDVATYVLSLSGRAPAGTDAAQIQKGQGLFAGICAACHGPEAKGNPALGAPDLSDNVWLYGDDLETVKTAIIQGRNGVMPAHGPLIGETRVRLVAAYALSLSQGGAGAP
ncbi:MAG: cytochrome-c oxidase, cbb3-type subunit [Pseudomonadota bacterium]